jgi:hypothetical protein
MKIWNYLTSYDGFGVFNKYWRRHFWYSQISSRIRPRNKWLTKRIPSTWVDKDTILEICVLESLKHYVDIDGEDAFHTLNTTNPPEQAEFMAKVKYYYKLTTIKLPAIQKEIDDEWDRIPDFNLDDINNHKPGDYDRIYGKIDRLEKELYDLQTEIMVWIVQNRNGLWT